MALLQGRPVLEHLVALCREHGFERIALLVHFEHEAISAHFEDGARWGVQLTYCVEKDARGTAGALCDALPVLDDRFLVLYGDTYADVDLRALWEAHTGSAGAAGTLFLHPNDHPADSDLVEIDGASNVVAIHPYPRDGARRFANLVNAALYVFERAPLAGLIPPTDKWDIARHMIPAMLDAAMPLRGYVSPEYIKDMGTPDRLDMVDRDIRAGLPARLSSRHPRSAVFLDRDGTINVEVGHLKSAEQLMLIPGAGEAIRALNRAGLLAVAVTNQPVLARGDADWQGMAEIHATLDDLLGETHAYLDRLYLCPHHPDGGFVGEVAALKTACTCRKPRSGMIDQAVSDLEIDRRTSWMIGDSTRDMLAGRRAGVRTIAVRTGHGGCDGQYACAPDYIAADLAGAVAWILHGHPALTRQLLSIAADAAAARLILVGGLARSGKTSTARALAEILSGTGRPAHIIAMDRWLKPAADRREGAGVLNRYDMAAFTAAILPVLEGASRVDLKLPAPDGAAARSGPGETLSIGPDDLVLVEGVPALLLPELVRRAAVRIFVECDEGTRTRRLQREYEARGVAPDAIARKLEMRAEDEGATVLESRALATHTVKGDMPT
jgi:D,D-heptose 1,7-bisphosphate phosphatase